MRIQDIINRMQSIKAEYGNLEVNFTSVEDINHIDTCEILQLDLDMKEGVDVIEGNNEDGLVCAFGFTHKVLIERR